MVAKCTSKGPRNALMSNRVLVENVVIVVGLVVGNRIIYNQGTLRRAEVVEGDKMGDEGGIVGSGRGSRWLLDEWQILMFVA